MATREAIDNLEEQDSVWFDSTAESQGDGARDLIYFVPGNPCLIEFYKPFLYELFKLLDDAREPGTNVSVGGFSLPGFEILNSDTNEATWSPNGLEQQVANVERLILRSIRKAQKTENLIEVNNTKTRVVLVAHSVGAYMVLEALRRRAEGINDLGKVEVTGAVLLFPTVTEIGKSWHGSLLSQFTKIPYFPAIISAISRGVTSLVATENLAWLISTLGCMPQHVGYATASFLKSPAGVYSALHLVTDEIATIQRDKWDETVWGESTVGTDSKGTAIAVPLRFYFGRQDVWVWNDARDALISSRGRSNEQCGDRWKPLMIVDEDNIPHGFIVHHSEIVADKTSTLIRDLFWQDTR